MKTQVTVTGCLGTFRVEDLVHFTHTGDSWILTSIPVFEKKSYEPDPKPIKKPKKGKK